MPSTNSKIPNPSSLASPSSLTSSSKFLYLFTEIIFICFLLARLRKIIQQIRQTAIYNKFLKKALVFPSSRQTLIKFWNKKIRRASQKKCVSLAKAGRFWIALSLSRKNHRDSLVFPILSSPSILSRYRVTSVDVPFPRPLQETFSSRVGGQE